MRKDTSTIHILEAYLNLVRVIYERDLSSDGRSGCLIFKYWNMHNNFGEMLLDEWSALSF